MTERPSSNGAGTTNGAVPEVDPGALRVLERISRSATRSRPQEACEMCGVEIPDEHPHVVNLESRSLLCTCRPCYLLFAPQGAAAGRFRAIPDRYLTMPGFSLSQADWDSLQIPVSVAFFFQNSVLGRIAAFYPSPAGATESLLPLEAWDRIAAANPVVATLEPDVEALLLRRDREFTDSLIVPIDACYELVGLLRTRWRGFDGGQEAHDALDAFFAGLQERSREAPA